MPTMKAAVCKAKETIVIEDVPRPKPKRGEVLVAVKATGLCGSDVDGYTGHHPMIKWPIILGHECSGIVAQVGPGERRWKPGDAVVVEPFFTCKTCRACLRGQYNLCVDLKITGHQVPGSMAEFVIAESFFLHPKPANLSFAEAAIAEPVSGSLHAVERANPRLGSFVAIIGCGTIGVLAMQHCLNKGAEVLVAEPAAFKRKVAKKLGVHHALDPEKEDLKARVRELTGGIGADVVIEAVGKPETLAATVGLFEQHAAKPPDADTARWLQELDWVEALSKEGVAAKLLEQATTLADAEKWKEASEALARLGEQCGETAFVEKNRPAVSDLARRVAAAIAATVRKEEPIKPYIDASEQSGDLAKGIKTYKPVGGWVLDVDNDGMLDIAFDIRRKAGDSPLVPIFVNRTKPDSPEVVFRDITAEAGLDTADEPICWADLDGDGDLDVVCRSLWSGSGAARQRDVKKLALYENTGKGVFSLKPERSLTPDIGKVGATANFGFANIAVLDANGDGRPDILAEYVGPFRTLILFGSVPRKPFVFDDVTEKAGFLKAGAPPAFLAGKAWPQYVVFDCDGDGQQDILYNSDTAILLRNGGRRGFAPAPAADLSYETYPSPATGNSPLIIPAVADYNSDGKIDIFVPQERSKNLLMQGQGDGSFKDALHTTGPMATDKNDSLWGTWGDVNDDGLPDLFVCNSTLRNRLYIQQANRAFADKADEYGVAGEKGEKTNFALFADFDRDGDLDLILLRDNGRSQLLLNPYAGADNRYYLSVLIRTPLGALGAKVTVVQLPGDRVVGFQQVARVEGFNRQTPPEAFFGLPAAGEYDVKIVLSDGSPLRRRVSVKPNTRNLLVVGREP